MTTTATHRDSSSASPVAGAHDLAASYAACKHIAKTHARNFYYGMKLTPEPKRSAMYAVYAWMRRADDLADQVGRREDKERQLDAFRGQTLDALRGQVTSDSPLWPAVSDTFVRYRVPAEYLHAMIDGQLLDQHQTRYATFAELDDYCYKVAGVVGLTCITIWGYQGGEPTRKLAVHRGAALQLTNILRDLREDAERDRVYLPADELRAAGYASPDDFRQAVLSRTADERFDKLMRQQLGRAHGLYDAAAPLEAQVTPDCRPTCWAMMRIYRGLLNKIAADPRRVLRERVRLSSFDKAMIALRATWRRKLGS